MRLRARTDANQASLVAYAKSFGASWVSMAPLGHGAPDGLLGFRGATYLVEVKTPKGTLTPDQREFIRDWQGSTVHIIRTLEDVERLLLGLVLTGAVRSEASS